jgi:acyl carrier protein
VTPDEIRGRVLNCVSQVAPEVDPAAVLPDVPFREQLDLDSMDFLRFVACLDAALSIAVPESEYADIATLDGCVRYFSSRVAPPA